MYKILFADDEENVLRYLPIAIDWETLGIGEMRTASDGKDALVQAKEFQPDIALVDVEMPGMDGLEFCRRVLKILPKLKLVIVSAFDRFDYAKRAIEIGVVDYILKPVDEEELEKLISKIVNNLNKSKKESRSIEEIKQKALEKEIHEFAEQIIKNDVGELELEKEFPFLELYENVSLVLWDNDNISNRKLPFEEEESGFSIRFAGNLWCFFWKRNDNISMWEQIEEITAEGKRKKEKFRFFYTRKKENETLAICLYRCFKAYETAFYTGEIHKEARNQSYNYEKGELPIPDLHEAIDYLAQEGDVSRIELLMRKALDRAFEEKKTVIDICSMIFDIFISLKIYLTKSCQEEALKIFRRMSIWTFLCCGTREELYAFVYKELKELQDFLETRKEGHENYYIVKVAKTYTKENYKNPNLSLQEVADAVGISRTYFSTVFRDLTGEKYWDYLTGCRIEQAKKLLRETNLSQGEISIMVGYTSEFHFSRKFKETVGLSPNKFRKGM